MSKLAQVVVGVAATALCALAAGPSWGTSSPPDECTFRAQVVRCPVAVAGTIVATYAIREEAGIPANRVSHLLVDDAVFGPCEAGDTLRVMWYADSGIAGAPAPVDVWTNARMLWLLRMYRGCWFPLPPIALPDRSPLPLRDRLSWIRNPPPCDMLFAATPARPEAPPASEVEAALLKLSRFGDWIELALSKADTGEVWRGRSN